MQETDDCQQLTKAIRAGEILPERSGEYWGNDEREKLTSLFFSGAGISQIALELQRSEMAVIQQLIVGKLLTTPGVTRTRKPKIPHCLCAECLLDGKCANRPFCQEGHYAGNL